MSDVNFGLEFYFAAEDPTALTAHTHKKRETMTNQRFLLRKSPKRISNLSNQSTTNTHSRTHAARETGAIRETGLGGPIRNPLEGLWGGSRGSGGPLQVNRLFGRRSCSSIRGLGRTDGSMAKGHSTFHSAAAVV